MKEKELIIHPIAPVYDNDSEILILGSFPSVRSREQRFFYGHPQNRFWKVLSAVYDNALPITIEEKKGFLISNHIAVWDVIASCEIEGSSDSTIKNVKENDLIPILTSADIRRIYVNGRTAEKMFKKYTQKKIHRECICLPSTSPANAAWNLERLIESWKVIKEYKWI